MNKAGRRLTLQTVAMLPIFDAAIKPTGSNVQMVGETTVSRVF